MKFLILRSILNLTEDFKPKNLKKLTYYEKVIFDFMYGSTRDGGLYKR